MSVGSGLQVGHHVHSGLDQFDAGLVGVVDPQAGYRTCIELIMLDRVGPEQFKTVTVCSNQSREPWNVGLHRHSEHVGKEPGGLFAVIRCRPNPDDPSDFHDTQHKGLERG